VQLYGSNFLHYIDLIFSFLSLHDFCTILHDFPKNRTVLLFLVLLKNCTKTVRKLYGVNKLIIIV